MKTNEMQRHAGAITIPSSSGAKPGVLTGRGLARTLASLAVVLGIGLPAARAELERFGPVDPAHGFPTWYQDKTGVALEFGTPLSQAELDGGWLLLLPGDTVVPEVFPSAFFDEHFYWSGGAGPIGFSHPDPAVGTSSASLVLALEAAFATGPAMAGDQVVFGRVRIRVNNLPYDGDYRVYTPFGVWDFPGQTAGARLFFTQDIGIGAPGDFGGALVSSIGPFLLPSDIPGGAEHGPTLFEGRQYIADPVRSGPVTGSPLPPFTSSVDGVTRDHNIFRIEGPAIPGTGDPNAVPPIPPDRWVLETTDFTLTGRLMTGPIAGRVAVDRTAYTRTATQQKVEVFATAFPTTTGRIPAAPRPPQEIPQLGFYNAPPLVDAAGVLGVPAGEPEIPMTSAGSVYWGQTQPLSIPPEVTVVHKNARDAAGAIVPAYFRARLTDAITVTEAIYDPTIATLSVRATSSDAVGLPALSVGGYGDLVNGQLLVTPLPAPPSKVRVLSLAGAENDMQVTTLFGALGGTILTPVNDTLTVAEDSAVATVVVLANDTYNGGPIPGGAVVAIVGAPRLGLAHVNPDNSIDYTPNLNRIGLDALTYSVTVGGVTVPATVNITITPVNDAPVALADSGATVVNIPATVNVLGNDTDVDGDTLIAVNLVQTAGPTPANATLASNGILTFSAALGGQYTFTYQAQDPGGLSSTATVTVNVSAGESILVTLSEFRTSKRRLRISGTDSIRNGQTLAITWANGTDTTTRVASPVVDATGAWVVDVSNAIGIQDPRNTGATVLRIVSPLGGATVASIVIRN